MFRDLGITVFIIIFGFVVMSNYVDNAIEKKIERHEIEKERVESSKEKPSKNV